MTLDLDALRRAFDAKFWGHVTTIRPVHRIATADDVAEVVVPAATDPNLTGTVIEVDGGARPVSLG